VKNSSTSNTVKLNLNDLVSVRLTRAAEERLESYINSSSQPHLVRRAMEAHMKADGTFETQLWDLMRLFGPGCVAGCAEMFEDCEITVIRPGRGLTMRFHQE
jgi:hypothetical protein